MNPKRTIGALHHHRLGAPVGNPLERVGERLADEARRVGQDVGDGAIGERRVVPGQDNEGQQDAADRSLSHAPRRGQRHAVTVDQLLRLTGDETGLGGFGSLGHALAIGASQLGQPVALERRKLRTYPAGVDDVACRDDRLACRRVLYQRGLNDRSALEDQPLRTAYHAIDEGAIEQLARGADIEPGEPGEPGALMERVQEALAIGGVGDGDIDVLPAAAGVALAALSMEKSARRGSPRKPLRPRKPGADRT